MEVTIMKTNKKVFLALTLVGACCVQLTHGMDYVKRGLSKAQEQYKPIAGTVAILGLGYWVYSMYSGSATPGIEVSPQTTNNTDNLMGEIATKFEEAIKIIETLTQKNKDLGISLDETKNTVEDLKYKNLQLDISNKKSQETILYQKNIIEEQQQHIDTQKKLLMEYVSIKEKLPKQTQIK